jgi:hypothetical protein
MPHGVTSSCHAGGSRRQLPTDLDGGAGPPRPTGAGHRPGAAAHPHDGPALAPAPPRPRADQLGGATTGRTPGTIPPGPSERSGCDTPDAPRDVGLPWAFGTLDRLHASRPEGTGIPRPRLVWPAGGVGLRGTQGSLTALDPAAPPGSVGVGPDERGAKRAKRGPGPPRVPGAAPTRLAKLVPLTSPVASTAAPAPSPGAPVAHGARLA